MPKVDSRTVFDLDYFFDLTPDLICIIGFDGFFKKINPAVSQTLGYTYKELMETPIDYFIHKADQKLTEQKRQQLLNGETVLNFENRFVAKDGAVIWLTWTSVPIKKDRLIFAIGKNITYRKQLDEYERISDILEMIHDDHRERFNKKFPESLQRVQASDGYTPAPRNQDASQADQLWLHHFEEIVRKHTGKLHLNLEIIGDEMAVGKRQLYRHVKRILGITPNTLIRVIRLQLAWEAIASGKYRTITEISNLAGYSSRAHFSKLFKNIYGINVSELL